MALQEAKQEATRIATSRELNTESLRLTAFLAPSAQVGNLTWWADLIGTQPETRTSKPSRGESTEAGPVGDCTLTLSVRPGRVDWFLTKRVPEGALPEGNWAGRFEDTLGVFVPLMARWVAVCPGLVRLAFGSVVHEPVPDRGTGYRRLAQLLPDVRLDPEHSEDFMYQINRPRQSVVIDGLKVNRFSRWSAAVLVPLMLVLEKEHVVQQQVSPGENTVRTELDVNTDPGFASELPAASLPQLFGELQNLTVELLTKGDIP